MSTLAERLQAGEVLHLPARVTHARRGAIRHAFLYRVDYVMLDPGRARGPALFSRNRFNLMSVHDRDHGGVRGRGQGAPWAWQVLARAGLERQPDMVMALMTQPRFMGYWFTPVSFWMVLRGAELLAVIAEVNNTFGQRHSYLCHLPQFAPIGPSDRMVATKVFHVSPFQDVAGGYDFRFDLKDGQATVQIIQRDGDEGLVAAMVTPVVSLSLSRLLRAVLRRPGGSLRVLALIYWNALLLKLKGAAYRPLPAAPEEEVSR